LALFAAVYVPEFLQQAPHSSGLASIVPSTTNSTYSETGFHMQLACMFAEKRRAVALHICCP